MGEEIAVVGAGPAGSWAASRLAAAGARVLLFDGSHPREKPCGGGVTGRALDLVADAVSTSALGGVAIESAVFEHEGTTPVRVRLAARGEDPGSRLGRPGPARARAETRLIVVSRAAFDGALLTSALGRGVRLVRERVLDVSADRSGIDLRTAARRYRCARVIGADGANSLIRRRLLRPFGRAQLSVATGYFAHGVTSAEIVVRFVSSPPGYIWSFPREDHLAIGICAPADSTSVGQLRARVEGWLRASNLTNGATLRPYAWPIPSLSAADLDGERPVGDRWMLVGDAAGLVDPITREGIYFGLRSAEEAAAALTEPAGRHGLDYGSRLRDEIYPELRRAARLKDRFFRPRFTALLVDALAASPGVRTVMADLVSGEQPYRGLRRRLLSTLELGLAWRLLSRRARCPAVLSSRP